MARVNIRDINAPKQKSGCLSKGLCSSCAIVIIVVFVITVVFSLFQAQNYSDFANSKTKNTSSVNFEVKQGESLLSIMNNLEKEGIIEDRSVFLIPASSLFLQFENLKTSNVQSGVFEIPANTPVKEIFKYFSPKECSQITITFKEGWRVEEFGQAIQKSLNGKSDAKFNYDEFISLARDYSPSSGLNLGFEPPKNVEGFLFPDTYNFCVESSSQTFLDRLISTFDSKVYSKIRDDLKTQKLDIEEVVNKASLVEREAFNAEERRVIVGIINNRLEDGMTLGIDATSQYSFGYSDSEKTWWVKGTELSVQLDRSEPYNTRKNTGLPPTPIASPGFDAVKAVLEPTPSKYYYYLHDANGVIHYAKTLNEHNFNVCRYINKTC